MVRVRFAPSPTGALHVGGARTALFNFLFARQNDGAFVLRIDDTDTERSRPEFEEDILRSLRWLGIEWDEGPDRGGPFGPYRQTERRAAHLSAIQFLLDQKAAYHDDGGAVRFRYRSGVTVVEDLICGRCEFTPQSLGPEPVLLRSDGNPTYHLASVSDDIEMQITHVIRGADHLTNTAKHQMLFEALGKPVPVFAHLPLLLGTDGAKLSKRSSTDLTVVREFIDAGFLSPALVNFLMLLGWSHPDGLDQLTLGDGIRTFSLERVKRTAAIFDTQKLKWLNGWWIRHLDVEELAEIALGFSGEFRSEVEGRGRAVWQRVVSDLRSEMHLLTEVEGLARLVFAERVMLDSIAKEYLRENNASAALLSVAEIWVRLLRETELEPGADSLSREGFQQLTAKLKKVFQGSSKELFHALRLLISGTLAGPELKVLVPLVRRELLLSRAIDIQHQAKAL